eukprot:3843565-Amphidinium_carterae.1
MPIGSFLTPSSIFHDTEAVNRQGRKNLPMKSTIGWHPKQQAGQRDMEPWANIPPQHHPRTVQTQRCKANTTP